MKCKSSFKGVWETESWFANISRVQSAHKGCGQPQLRSPVCLRDLDHVTALLGQSLPGRLRGQLHPFGPRLSD